MEDDGDEIIETIPVFLSKTLSNQLNILQYPFVNPAHFDTSHVVNSCVKPLTQQIKIDFALNTASPNYDAFKGDQLAIAVDGANRSKNDPKPTFRSGRMDKQSYISSVLRPKATGLCIGIIKEGEMHLTPVQEVYHMRPSFSYFDKQDERIKAEKRAEDGDVGDEEETRHVTVKFARNESDKVKKAREKSYGYIARIGAEEPWCETMWHPASSEMAGMESQKLLMTGSPGSIFTHLDTLNMDGLEYLAHIIGLGETQKEKEESKALVARGKAISNRKAKSLSLAEQLKNLLTHAKVVPFHLIQSRVTEQSTEKILRVLQTIGTLLRGNWVIQSEVLYPENSVSAVNGVPATLMIRAREYVIYKLSYQTQLNRTEVLNKIQLPSEEGNQVLTSVAKLTGKVWELLQREDKEFQHKYPELVERQQLYWDAKAESFREMETSKEVKRIRKKSHRESK